MDEHLAITVDEVCSVRALVVPWAQEHRLKVRAFLCECDLGGEENLLANLELDAVVAWRVGLGDGEARG